jgi:hypothetical protein
MLLLRLVQVPVDHLENGVLGVDLSVVVLLIDLHLLLELLGLGDSHDLSPVREDLHTIEVSHLLLLVHRVLQVVTTHLHLLLLLVKVLQTLVLVTNLDKGTLLVCGRRLEMGLRSRNYSFALHKFA